jgi:hypothetical protein
MVQEVASADYGYLPAGLSLKVPGAIAQKWLESGIAEEDKMLNSTPELK